MKFWKRTFPVAAVFVSLLMLACAGAPKTIQPPDWVLSNPADDAEFTYFVGHGVDGDLPTAEEAALGAIVDDIMRFIGVKITSESTAEAKASLDDFQASVRQVVKQSGSADVKGFRIADRYVYRDAKGFTVYLLGKYVKNDLNAEKRRLESEFAERQEAISGPEEEGDKKALLGDHYAAFSKYVEAASAAMTSTVANASIKFERLIQKAKESLSLISLEAARDSFSVMVNSPFPERIRVRAKAGGDGLANVPLIASYKEVNDRGRSTIKNISLVTGGNGVVDFLPPPVTFVGKGQITVYLDASAVLSVFDKAPRSVQTLINGLNDEASGKRVVINFEAMSAAKTIPTAVLVLDVDTVQKPTGSRDVESGILQALSSAGFATRTVSVDVNSMISQGEQEFVSTMKETYGSQIKRLAYGTVMIEEFTEDSGSYIVKVSGVVKVVDLETGSVIFTDSRFKRARAGNSTSAITSAFRGIGLEFGEKMAAELP